jgi:MFS family permease
MAGVQKDPEYRRRVDPLVVAVNALGITQITAWGTSFYCLGVLAKPIVADTGWPLTTVFLGFTVALLVMGFISTWVGRLIDRAGARVVMCVGTIIVSAGLVALSQVRDPASYLVAWVIVGIGMRCCLYDAAFAALVQVTPTRGRKAISYLTLYGAYASTVFWVLGHYLNEAYGWRGTLIAFAAINLGVCLPLNWLGLAYRDPPQDTAAAAATPIKSPDGPVLEGRMRVVGMVLFALIMSLNGFVFGIISIQLVPLLEAAGLAGATAVWVASLKGHGQFAGRLVITIVRGAVPLALFGAEGYGAVLGVIATPILLVNAFSPAIFALLVDQFGWQTSLYVLFGCSMATWIAMEVMSRWYAGAQARAVDNRLATGA